MGMKLLAAGLLALSLTLTGCTATDQNSGEPTPEPTPTIDQDLVPTAAPEGAVTVDPAKFLTSYGDLIFKVGEGPTWCTLSEFDDFAICEQREFDATYAPIPTPEGCDFTYGYQLRLRGNPVAGSAMAEFTCASANWSDATGAPVLASGEQVTAFGFSCFVEKTTARCENNAGDYIVLGPDVWALSQ